MTRSGTDVIISTLGAFTWLLILLSLVVFSLYAVARAGFDLRSRSRRAAIAYVCGALFGAPYPDEPRAWLRATWSSLRGLLHRPRVASPVSPERGRAEILDDTLTAIFHRFGRSGHSGRTRFAELSTADLLHAFDSTPWMVLAPEIDGTLLDACDTIAGLEGLRKQLLELPASLPPVGLTRLMECLGALNEARLVVCGPNGQPRPNATVAEILSLRAQQDDVFAELRALRSALLHRDGARMEPDASEAVRFRDLIAAVQSRLLRLAHAMAFIVAAVHRKREQLCRTFAVALSSADERDARASRVVLLGVALALAVVLHANILRVYRTIARNELLRAPVDSITREIQRREAARLASDPGGTPALLVTATTGSLPLDTDFDATPSPLQQRRALDEAEEELSGRYAGAGIAPITIESAETWWHGFINRATLDGRSWLQRRIDDVTDFGGEVTMAVLLSIGATFWRRLAERLGPRRGDGHAEDAHNAPA